jgi:hypothetical protein
LFLQVLLKIKNTVHILNENLIAKHLYSNNVLLSRGIQPDRHVLCVDSSEMLRNVKDPSLFDKLIQPNTLIGATELLLSSPTVSPTSRRNSERQKLFDRYRSERNPTHTADGQPGWTSQPRKGDVHGRQTEGVTWDSVTPLDELVGAATLGFPGFIRWVLSRLTFCVCPCLRSVRFRVFRVFRRRRGGSSVKNLLNKLTFNTTTF